MAPMNIQTVSCQTNRLFAFCHVSLISDQPQPRRRSAGPQLRQLVARPEEPGGEPEPEPHSEAKSCQTAVSRRSCGQKLLVDVV